MPEPKDEVEPLIRRFLLDEFLPGEDPKSLTDTTPLVSGGILDSIGTLKLVTFLEQRFGVTFDAWELGAEHIDTVQQIARTVRSKIAPR
jgi:acyl carrier protein